ncbi:MAG TPA: YraN family protein [Candidatus Caenarcaniphilales bacterium]|nr:YraN family protein [Candidatus Caenarcaniphilales bacterium]
MTGRRTTRQRNGAAAEDEAVRFLIDQGWSILGRNVRAGRDEVDVVAVDPDTPETIVCVEIRSLKSAQFGVPEERVDRRKVTHLYRAMAALRASRDADDWPGFAWRVDLLIVDRRPGHSEVRHLRALEPPG